MVLDFILRVAELRSSATLPFMGMAHFVALHTKKSDKKRISNHFYTKSDCF